MPVNGSGLQNATIQSFFFEDSVKNSLFLHVSIKASIRQLTRTEINKDKSIFLLRISIDNSALGKFKCVINLSLSIFLVSLLLRQGIEPNPGPVDQNSSANDVCATIISQNCRGLTDPSKVISLLKKAYSRPNQAKILCLQETHHLDRFTLDNHFQGSCVVDNGERDRKGTAILVPEQFTICLSRISGRGRWALAAIKDRANDGFFGDKLVVIASIYAPNCHRASLEFFDEFFEAVDEFMEEVATQYSWPYLVIAGDFNFVFNPNFDSLNRQNSQAEATLATTVEGKLEELELLDSIWLYSQGIDRFTWRRANCCSRLDYIFLSTGLSSIVQSANTEWYMFGSNYDHASVSIKIGKKIGFTRGRSFPKIYKSDIASPRSVAWIAERLEEAKSQIPSHWNPHQVHEFLKMTLRSKTLEVRAMNRNQTNVSSIKERINQLLRVPTVDSLRAVDQLKAELFQAEEVEAEVIRLRAGIKWREHGERSSKYFLGRLKSREATTELHSLVDDSGIGISSLQGIIEHVKSFYVSLYKSTGLNPDLALAQDPEFFSQCPTLDLVQQQLLMGPISIEELKESLKTCQDSSPGLDGIPYSFYTTFGEVLLPSLLNSWNHALATGQLAQSHLQSCITLLPKKNKNLKRIQNWRPISLSPCDLKIITKSYARRLNLVLPHVLSESQAAYVPGRDINFNNRLLRTAQKYAHSHNKDYSVVSLDARKAFDSVSHTYLIQVLEAYGFPAEFVKVFKTLYKDNNALVQVNGHLSSPFQIERGVKQGDALSCGLFVLAIDPLLRNIAANLDIKGLSIPTEENESIEIKVLAYADDVAVICKNRDLQPIFSEYERLTKFAGLELNADKTEVFNLIDSNFNISRIIYQGTSYTLGRLDTIKICGLYLNRQQEIDYQLNVLASITRMEKLVTSWMKRGLSLNGRMIAAKTFLLSQIVFQAQALNIAVKEIKKIERLIYSFVNGSKTLYGPERIARIRLKASKEQGGINGVDVDSFVKSIQIRQYSKAMDKHRLLRALQSSYKGCDDELGDAVNSLLRSHYRASLKEGIPDLQQIVTVSGVPLRILLKPGTRAFSYVADLSIFTLYELQRAIGNNRLTRPQLNIGLKQLPGTVRNLVRSNSFIDCQPSVIISTAPDSFSAIAGVSSAQLRSRLLDMRCPTSTVYAKDTYKQPLWQEPDDWQKLIWKIKNPHLRGYRLKLLYKDIFSNERRHRFGLTDSPSCAICNQVESVSHQLLGCTNAQRLWNMYRRITGNDISSMLDVITCTTEIEKEIAKSVIIKRLIQIDRSEGFSFERLKQEIKHYYRIEACISDKSKHFWERCIRQIEQAQ